MYSFWGFVPLLLIHLHKGLLAERIVGTFSLVTLEHETMIQLGFMETEL